MRFPAQTVATIKKLADADGVTVSAWVRRAVDAELARRTQAGAQAADVADELERLAQRLRASA